MKITISKKYLIFPVNTNYAAKRLRFFAGDNEMFCLDLKLDNISPNFHAYIDVSRFAGQTLSIIVSPEMKISYEESDEMDIKGLYSENMRPQAVPEKA